MSAIFRDLNKALWRYVASPRLLSCLSYGKGRQILEHKGNYLLLS